MKFPPQPFDNETVIHNSNGMQLRTESAEEAELISYLRVCDPDGDELMYWSIDEVTEDASLVIGAIIGLLCNQEYAKENRYA